jgi:hypothetical protein
MRYSATSQTARRAAADLRARLPTLRAWPTSSGSLRLTVGRIYRTIFRVRARQLTVLTVVIAAAAVVHVAAGAASRDSSTVACAAHVKYQIPVEFVKATSLPCYEAETVAVNAYIQCDSHTIVKNCAVQLWLPMGRPFRAQKLWTFKCLFDDSFTSEATYGRVCVGQARRTSVVKTVRYIIEP